MKTKICAFYKVHTVDWSFVFSDRYKVLFPFLLAKTAIVDTTKFVTVLNYQAKV